MTSPSARPYRIGAGAGAGFAGDRIDPARDPAERGGLDALFFECLAERTIALAQGRRSADPELGYDPLLAARLRACAPCCRPVCARAPGSSPIWAQPTPWQPAPLR